MSVDIRGTTTANKGAQLMLEAVVERLGPHFSLSAAPAVLEYDARARLGLLQTLHVNRFPKTSAVLGDALPKTLRTRYGIVTDTEITGIVDASGFAYSDSFRPRTAEREARFGETWRKRGVPKVMLPQAFGPFEKSATAAAAKRVLGQAEIVFVRDTVSEKYLQSLNVATTIKRSPDFTIGLSPTAVSPIRTGEFAAIVPNGKMISTGVSGEDEYLNALSQYAVAATSHGLEVVIVVHEKSDKGLALKLSERTGAALYENDDPRQLKGAISQASILVASRFHAVVGGLSQGVPTIALGWSHKYQELLNDFEVPAWIARIEDLPAALFATVLHDRDGLSRVNSQKSALVHDVNSMWDITSDILSR